MSATGTSETGRDRGYPVGVALLSLIVLAASLLWAVTTPAFHGPDEALHYNSVNRLLDGGGWPEPYTAPVKASTWRAVGESTGARVLFQGPAVREMRPAAPGDRSAMDDGSGLEDRGRDQMVQHPPTFYLLGAGVLQVGGGTSLPWDTALMTLRVLSAVLTAAAVPFVVGVGRRLTGSRRAGLLGATSLLAIPFFSTMGGYVTNDSLLLLTTSAALYCAVRTLDAERLLTWLLLTGLGLGAALLTKGLALFLIPVVGVLTLMAVLRRPLPVHRRLALLLVPQAVAFVVGGWWWLRNLLTLGSVQPSQCGVDGGCTMIAPTDPPPPDPWFFAVSFVKRFSQTFWGRGGVETIAYPYAVTTAATLLLVAMVLTAVLLTRRRTILLSLVAAPVLITVVLFTNAYGIYVDVGVPNRGVQGRYVFSTAAVLAACAAVLWVRWDRRTGRMRLTAAGAVLLSVAVAAAGWWWVVARLWAPPDGGLRRGVLASTESTGSSVGAVVALGIVLAIATAAFAILLLRHDLSAEAPRRSVPSPG